MSVIIEKPEPIYRTFGHGCFIVHKEEGKEHPILFVLANEHGTAKCQDPLTGEVIYITPEGQQACVLAHKHASKEARIKLVDMLIKNHFDELCSKLGLDEHNLDAIE